MNCRGFESSCMNAGKPACWSFGNFVNLSGMNECLFAVPDRLFLSCFHSCMKEGMAHRKPTSPGGAHIPEGKRECVHLRMKEATLAVWPGKPSTPLLPPALPPARARSGSGPVIVSLPRTAYRDLTVSSMLVGEERGRRACLACVPSCLLACRHASLHACMRAFIHA